MAGEGQVNSSDDAFGPGAGQDQPEGSGSCL